MCWHWCNRIKAKYIFTTSYSTKARLFLWIIFHNAFMWSSYQISPEIQWYRLEMILRHHQDTWELQCSIIIATLEFFYDNLFKYYYKANRICLTYCEDYGHHKTGICGRYIGIFIEDACTNSWHGMLLLPKLLMLNLWQYICTPRRSGKNKGEGGWTPI